MTTTTHQDTLLVIDDTLDNVNLLLKFLTAAGFKVLIAQDGEEGIETAEYTLPELILLDVIMPEMDGFEVCRYLKSQEKTRDIPIIFMSALTDTVNKVNGFKLGAADYITKPIQHEEVLARVNAHLQIIQQQRKIQSQNEQVTEYAQALEKRNSELDAFAHTVAHDLKTPLNGIVGLSDILVESYSKRTPLDADLLSKLQMIKRASQRTFNIIDALLLLAGVSRMEQLKISPLDMSDIVTQVIDQRLVDLVEDYSGLIDKPSYWPMAQGYARWIEEVWINYISNALKYGGNPPHLELGAEVQNEGMICFWVRDNGKGLTPEEQAQLFTPFTRLHITRIEGHGLGLSIVRQIVEQLGGQVGVESEVGQGSRFYFTLPSGS